MALFGRRTEKRSDAGIYLLMDRNARMLARGKRTNHPSEDELEITLIEGNPAIIKGAEIVQAVPQDKSLPPQMTRVIACGSNSVTLTPMRELNSEVRRNFRIPVTFDSFVYPATGGRASMRSIDLSCGGVAFRSPASFAVGNIFEVVIPLTREGPLLLNAEILRVHLELTGGNFYACKFIHMIDEEESMLREAVFAIQLNSARAKNN